MLLDLLFPNRCIQCSRMIEENSFICNLCYENLGFYHYNNSSGNILRSRCNLLFPTEDAFALLEFEKEGLSRAAVHALKYKGRKNIGKILADWTAERIDFQKIKADLMLAVPLHPKKLQERGYNQLHLYTETLSQLTGIPFNHQLATRNIYKKSQTFKDKIHRSEGLNVFSVLKDLSDTHVLLVDDVFTTGSTMSHFAWEILKNPTNKVSILIIAVDL